MPNTLISLLQLSLMLLLLTGCAGPGSFYRRPRPTSFYVTRYCFEVPKPKVQRAVEWFLKKQKFQLSRNDPKRNIYQTQPVVFPRYGRNVRDYGYTIGLRFQILHSKGPLDLKSLPGWAIDGKSPKPPKPPNRKDFPSDDAFTKAQEAYIKRVSYLSETMEKGVALGKKWQGCRLRKSRLRTVVIIKAEVRAYKLKRPFYTIDLKGPSKPVPTNRTVEYSILRIIGKRLDRLRFMPPLMF